MDKSKTETMGWKCCVPKCRSGYDSQTLGTSKISFHRFPSDQESKQKWIRNIPRQQWEPNDNSRVCSLHFKEGDFQVESKDKRERQKKARNNETLAKKVLLPDAVPSVFPHIPDY